MATIDDERDDAPIGDGDDEPAGRAVDVALDLGDGYATGGVVEPGASYLVGENGPEILG